MYYLYGIEVKEQEVNYPRRIIYVKSDHSLAVYSYSIIEGDYLKYYIGINDCMLIFREFRTSNIWKVPFWEFFNSGFQCEDLYSCYLSTSQFSCYVYNRCIEMFERYTDLRSLAFTHNVKDSIYSVFADVLVKINWWKCRVNNKNVLYFRIINSELKLNLHDDFSKLKTGLLKCKVIENPNRILDTGTK